MSLILVCTLSVKGNGTLDVCSSTVQKHHSMGGKTSSGVEDGHQQEEGDIPHNTPPESHTLVGEVIPHKVLRYSALHRDACGHLLCKQLLSETTGLWWHEVRQILRARGRTLPELPPGPPPKPRPSEVFRCGMPVASTHAFSRLQWKAAGQHSKPLHSSAPGHGGVSAAPPSTFVPASAVLREQVRPSPFHGMGFSSASSLLLCDRKLLPPTAERKTSAPSPSDVTGQSEKGRKNRIPSRQDAADSKAGELGMVRVHEGPRKIRSKASKRSELFVDFYHLPPAWCGSLGRGDVWIPEWFSMCFCFLFFWGGGWVLLAGCPCRRRWKWTCRLGQSERAQAAVESRWRGRWMDSGLGGGEENDWDMDRRVSECAQSGAPGSFFISFFFSLGTCRTGQEIFSNPTVSFLATSFLFYAPITFLFHSSCTKSSCKDCTNSVLFHSMLF